MDRQQETSVSELVWGSLTFETSDVHVLFVNFNGLDPVDIRLSSP